MSAANGTNNEGHGHVYPRPDGVRMRCGGPGLCKKCSADMARKVVEAEKAANDSRETKKEARLMTAPKLLIGFSGYAGAGKDTAADALPYWSWERVKFAAPLKAMMRALLGDMEVPEEVITRMIDGDLKGRPHWALGYRTPRHVMQTLGTEWGRNTIAENFWTSLAAEKVRSAWECGKSVVITDVRFENEVDMIHELGGTVVRINRPGVGPVNDHASEQLPPYDIAITNEGSVDVFHANVRNLIAGIQKHI